MRFTQASLLALSSAGALLVTAAPVAVGAGKRGLVATAEVLSCGSAGGPGLTVKAGRAGNCPVGWGRPHYDHSICVQIDEPHSASHKPSSTHKSSHKSTSTHHASSHSTNKATHPSPHKPFSTHKSSTKHAEPTFHPGSVKAASTTHKASTTHRPSSTAHRSSSPSPSPKPAAQPRGQDQSFDSLLAMCVDLDLGSVASLGGELKIGNPLGPGAKAPLAAATAGLDLDLGDVASLGGGLKIGGPGAKPHGATTTSKASQAKATTSASSSGNCSDEDALLHVCVKVGNLVGADATVAGSKGLAHADTNIAGAPVKATLGSSNGKLVDADAGNGVVMASSGGKDGLVDAHLGDGVKLSAGSTSAAASGASKQAAAKACPEGELLHLGVCVKANVSLLGINAAAAADVPL